jgi:FkbM family methyltransferase
MTKLLESYLKKKHAAHREIEMVLSSVEEPTIFDVGSCEGLDSIRYSRMFPKAKIFAFEPIASNFEKIIENIRVFDSSKIYPFHLALSEKKSIIEIFKSSGNPENEKGEWEHGNKSSSILAPEKHLEVYDWCKFESKEEVESDTLKSFCNQQDIKLIDLLHMDVQGAELLVLQGADDFLSNIRAIWMEVAYLELYKDQPLKDEVTKYMKERGFLLLVEQNRVLNGDHLYVNEEMLKEDFAESDYKKILKQAKANRFKTELIIQNIRSKMVAWKMSMFSK